MSANAAPIQRAVISFFSSWPFLMFAVSTVFLSTVYVLGNVAGPGWGKPFEPQVAPATTRQVTQPETAQPQVATASNGRLLALTGHTSPQTSTIGDHKLTPDNGTAPR